MKYGVIGTGAVGGYYGSLLSRCGFDVHFLLHSDYEHVRDNGLIIESINGDFTLPNINAYSHAEDMPQCDVVIIALKTTQNAQLPEILPHIVKKGSIVIILQNGLGIEKDIARIVPDAVVMGGLCFLCSNKIGPGHIRHIDYGAISIGEYAQEYKPTGITAHLRFISQEFERAGIPVKLRENIGQARWEKLVWNVPFNGLSVILNSTTDQLIASSSARCLIREIMIEVITGAGKCGYSIDDKLADEMLKATEQMTPYKPSMKLDFEAGRPLEIKEIYWQPITDAESAGYSMTLTRALALQLEYLDRGINSN